MKDSRHPFLRRLLPRKRDNQRPVIVVPNSKAVIDGQRRINAVRELLPKGKR
jgi:hypothetical protein